MLQCSIVLLLCSGCLEPRRLAMPLRDHFNPPLAPIRDWESFQTRWAASLADALNALLPERYFAEPQTTRHGNTAALPAPTWSVSAPALSMPGVCPEAFAVLVFHDD